MIWGYTCYQIRYIIVCNNYFNCWFIYKNAAVFISINCSCSGSQDTVNKMATFVSVIHNVDIQYERRITDHYTCPVHGH